LRIRINFYVEVLFLFYKFNFFYMGNHKNQIMSREANWVIGDMLFPSPSFETSKERHVFPSYNSAPCKRGID
jgi:hypothetical protein